jgi:hypothetical protein
VGLVKSSSAAAVEVAAMLHRSARRTASVVMSLHMWPLDGARTHVPGGCRLPPFAESPVHLRGRRDMHLAWSLTSACACAAAV